MERASAVAAGSVIRAQYAAASARGNLAWAEGARAVSRTNDREHCCRDPIVAFCIVAVFYYCLLFIVAILINR